MGGCIDRWMGGWASGRMVRFAYVRGRLRSCRWCPCHLRWYYSSVNTAIVQRNNTASFSPVIPAGSCLVQGTTIIVIVYYGKLIFRGSRFFVMVTEFRIVFSHVHYYHPTVLNLT